MLLYISQVLRELLLHFKSQIAVRWLRLAACQRSDEFRRSLSLSLSALNLSLNSRKNPAESTHWRHAKTRVRVHLPIWCLPAKSNETNDNPTSNRQAGRQTDRTGNWQGE